MKSLYLPQLLTVFVVSAASAAQSPWGFPIDQHFVATSLNGKAYSEKAPTLAVTRSLNQSTLHGAGFAGCNRWMGEITINHNRIGVGNLGATKMYCSERMTNEATFLTALKSVKRWRMDGAQLVLEGDQTMLTLSPVDPNKP